jgi:hypothetical protein
MSTRVINNVGSVAVDKFSNIFIADSGNYIILKFDDSGKFITKGGFYGSGDGQVDDEGKFIESLHFSNSFFEVSDTATALINDYILRNPG